jgi:hypothetical protein
MTEAEIWMEKMEVITKQTEIGNAVGSVGDPPHVDADTVSTFHSDPDQDPTFQLDADPDPDPTTHFLPDLNSPMLQNDPLRLFTLMQIRILLFT